MRIRAIARDATKVRADALIVDLFQGVKRPDGATGAVDRALDGAISKLIADGEVKGKKGELTLIHVFRNLPASRVAVLGLGPRRSFDAEVVRTSMAEAARAMRRIGAKRIATVLHGAGAGGLEPGFAAQAIAEGALLGLYAYRKQVKNADAPSEVLELTIVEVQRSKLREVRD
ncbi:MAG: hypothetical protein IIC20_00650, partial [Chloroflexi bacterium]|nr:hypothetical protein [Chloroflexota bacterium]